MQNELLFDGHCDTIEKMLDINQNLTSSLLSVNLLEAKNNLPYIQCLATFVHDDYAKKKRA